MIQDTKFKCGSAAAVYQFASHPSAMLLLLHAPLPTLRDRLNF
jgi:hypothetical protein